MGNGKHIKVHEIIGLTSNKKRATLVLLVVFLLDLFTPLRGELSALYLFCFFYISRESKKTIIVFALIILLFSIITFITSYSLSNNYMVLFNKAITAFVIIITTICTVRYKKLYDRIDNDRNTYVKELSEMQFMVSHRMRKPITSYLELMHIVESEKVLTQEELKLIMKHVKLSALELDSFTTELTKLMCESVKKCRLDELKTKA
ncbi:MAG: hypothetical protein V4511_11660 [Bacteroidota bacterium]